MLISPAFILLHGAWHTPKVWSRVAPLLTSCGYEVVTPHLPSSGGDPPIGSIEPDVRLIRSSVEQLLEQGKDVVVVAHSYAGAPMGTALEGLEKREVPGEVEKAGVVKLVYLDAFLVPEGYQNTPTGQMPVMGEGFVVDKEKGVITVLPSVAKAAFYSDVDEAGAAELMAELQPQSLGPFWSKTTSAAWRVISTTCIICTKSQAPEVFRGMVDAAKNSTGGNKIENVIELDSSHTPMYSQPQKLAEILRREAGEDI